MARGSSFAAPPATISAPARSGGSSPPPPSSARWASCCGSWCSMGPAPASWSAAGNRDPLERGRMGLLDYYRQFEGMSEEEVNQGLREQAAERRRKALTRVETLDLSQTTWPELAHPSIVTAITCIARRGLRRYPHLRGSRLHDELAARHGVDPGRLILGNGAA